MTELVVTQISHEYHTRRSEIALGKTLMKTVLIVFRRVLI